MYPKQGNKLVKCGHNASKTQKQTIKGGHNLTKTRKEISKETNE